MLICFLFVLGVFGCLKEDEEVSGTEPCVVGAMRDADCNTCECDDSGEWLCTELDCGLRPCEEDECGPRPAVPDQVCADGTTAGIGECVRSENGTCGWSRTECPPECEPGDELTHFNGNSCVCNGAGEYECVCDGDGPAPDCQCLTDGTWACPGGPPEFMCQSADDCQAVYDTCACDWLCVDPIDAEELGACDVDCGERSEAPVCDCRDGNCTRADEPPPPPPVCEGDDAACQPFYDTCLCAWTCTGDDISNRPQCDQLCEGMTSEPDVMCACTAEGCVVDAVCMDGDSKPADDGCNTCTCLDGQWACTERACPPEMCAEGDTRDAEDGCNTCVCSNGEWACTERACPPEMCEDGDTREAEDGCNTCTCLNGQWACTLIACPTACEPQECGPQPSVDCPPGSTSPPVFECRRDNPAEECQWTMVRGCDEPPPPPGPFGCVTDDDCFTSGCNGEICASEALSSTCDRLPEHACYSDPNITSCGCMAGSCGWSNRPALDMCIEEARREGPLPPPDGRDRP